MSMIKYRVHEVAKDFNVTSKVISQILTDYIAPPKNHMQVLETNELDVIFEYLTQHNQVGSIAEIFAPEPEKPAAAPAPAVGVGQGPGQAGGVVHGFSPGRPGVLQRCLPRPEPPLRRPQPVLRYPPQGVPPPVWRFLSESAPPASPVGSRPAAGR